MSLFLCVHTYPPSLASLTCNTGRVKGRSSICPVAMNLYFHGYEFLMSYHKRPLKSSAKLCVHVFLETGFMAFTRFSERSLTPERKEHSALGFGQATSRKSSS